MFITFEGPEGGGKSTQISRLADSLRHCQLDAYTTREPGGVMVAEEIRDLVLGSRVHPETEALLFLAARAEHVLEVIRPRLDRGDVVICDRFSDSTIAYQGYGLGLDVERLRTICDFASGGLWPNITLLLDVPPQVGLGRRLTGRGEVFTGQMHFEMDILESDVSQSVNLMDNRVIQFHERVREGFLLEAEAASDRIVTIDATQDVDTVQQSVWAAVVERMPGLRLVYPSKVSPVQTTIGDPSVESGSRSEASRSRDRSIRPEPLQPILIVL